MYNKALSKKITFGSLQKEKGLALFNATLYVTWKITVQVSAAIYNF